VVQGRGEWRSILEKSVSQSVIVGIVGCTDSGSPKFQVLASCDSSTLQQAQDAVAFSLQPHECDAVARSDRGRHVKQCYGHQRFECRRRNNQAAVGDITRPTVSACLHNHWPL
jgi:hypothetical protein